MWSTSPLDNAHENANFGEYDPQPSDIRLLFPQANFTPASANWCENTQWIICLQWVGKMANADGCSVQTGKIMSFEHSEKTLSLLTASFGRWTGHRDLPSCWPLPRLSFLSNLINDPAKAQAPLPVKLYTSGLLLPRFRLRHRTEHMLMDCQRKEDTHSPPSPVRLLHYPAAGKVRTCSMFARHKWQGFRGLYWNGFSLSGENLPCERICTLH